MLKKFVFSFLCELQSPTFCLPNTYVFFFNYVQFWLKINKLKKVFPNWTELRKFIGTTDNQVTSIWNLHSQWVRAIKLFSYSLLNNNCVSRFPKKVYFKLQKKFHAIQKNQNWTKKVTKYFDCMSNKRIVTFLFYLFLLYIDQKDIDIITNY